MRKGDIGLFSDHDMLIRLDTKFDDLSMSVKTLADGMSARVSLLEQRVDNIDVYHAKIPLEKLLEDARWVEGFRSNIKLILFVVTPIMAIFVAIISRLIAHFFKI